ncbi:hypothetical protein, conserved [Plasmodium vivax]|uniref:Uncharacterized protein n=1 Tax=Plasmodium vivax (strain Salvador I) TaxID=126793 RepID=A5K628_PLAVS|nr:hypothetical protein, conserved [Plasmodium vivax]EDL45363.1 hypothetical protein, conserved [Plasmodium vivax]|eukprot:XP_001615090.1 hypothetical protein [Plasmodium vivax Sal-1]
MPGETQNTFDLVDVEPKFLEFHYEGADSVEAFLENKKKVIKRKGLKIKNICTKTQNIKICECDSKCLKIKGLKKKKLAPGTSEQILVEFSFADVNFKESKRGKQEDILEVVNNVEATSYVTIQSEYTTLSIPIYIKKSIPVFAYDDVINFGVCNANRTYHFALRVKNVGTRRGAFTLSLGDSPGGNADECEDGKPAESAQSGENSVKQHRRNCHSEDMLIRLDQSSLELDVGETKTINITVSSKVEGKMHREYIVVSNQHSYFVEKQRNINVLAIFTNSHTSFLFENEKTNLLNLHCLYYGSRKKYQGKIKNENNYGIFCTPRVDAVHVFYSKEELQTFAAARGLDLGRICRDVFLEEEERLSEGEKKEREKLFAITKKRLKGEEHIGVTFCRGEGYPVERLSYQEVTFEIQSKSDAGLLHRLSRDTAYLLNFPVVVELSLRVGRSRREASQVGITTKQAHRSTSQVCSSAKQEHKSTSQVCSSAKLPHSSSKLPPLSTKLPHSSTEVGDSHPCDEEVKLWAAFCLTFPCVLPSTYLLSYGSIAPNEGKTVILELTNRNKFLKVSYTLSKIPYLTLSKKEGVIPPQGKALLSLKLQCDSLKMVEEYMYIYFCNNLFFFVLLVRGNITSANALRKGTSSILLDPKGDSLKRNTPPQGDSKQDRDQVYEQILHNLELEKVSRNYYQLDGKLDKYKYNERFINFLKKNKKKYNDVLKLMYEERKKSESVRSGTQSQGSPDKSGKIIKGGTDKLSKIMTDKFIYVNNPPVDRISNTCIEKGVYERERKKYIQMKTTNWGVKNGEPSQGGEEQPYLLQFDMLDEEELKRVQFVRVIQYGNIFLGKEYTRKFAVFNRNKHCSVRVALTHSENVTTEGDNPLVIHRDSHKMGIIKLNVKRFSTAEEPHHDAVSDGDFRSQTGVSTPLFEAVNLPTGGGTSTPEGNTPTALCADPCNDFFLLKTFQEKISLTVNDSHEREVTLGATLVFLNILVHPHTLHFRFHDEDVGMFCERHLVLYNPFNVPLRVGMACNRACVQLDAEISVPPNSHKIVPVKFVATESATSVAEAIRLYLDGSRLYRSLTCKWIANKCSYRVTPAELNFENVLLNKTYVKEFFLINTGDSPVVFRCSYKPDCVNLLSKHNYVKKNEKVKISVLLNLKECKKMKDKVVLAVRGAPQLLLPLSAKGTPSNVLISGGLRIRQRRGELKCYEMKIANRGPCEEAILLDTSPVGFLNIQMGHNNERTFSESTGKESKDASKRENVLTVERTFNQEYDDLLTDECAKYQYSNFLRLHNLVSSCYQNKGQILFNEKRERKNIYRVVVPSKCFLPLYIQCYSSRALTKEITLHSLLHCNRAAYECKEESITVDIEEGHLDVSPPFLLFTDLLPQKADEAYITYFSRERRKRLTIRNVLSQPVQWAVRLDEEKRRELYTVRGAHRGGEQIAERRGEAGKSRRVGSDIKGSAIGGSAKRGEAPETCVTQGSAIGGSAKRGGATKSPESDEPAEERQYQVHPSRERGILQPNEETTVEIKLSGFKQCGRYVDVLDISSSPVGPPHGIDSEEAQEQREAAEGETHFALYMLIRCDVPKLQFDVTYINITHNKLNECISFSFGIYSHGYHYVRVDSHLKNPHAECFSISLHFIDGNEINERVKKLRVQLKCKASRWLTFKSSIVLSVMDHHQYALPLFVSIDEGVDFLLGKASGEGSGETSGEISGETSGVTSGETSGEISGETTKGATLERSLHQHLNTTDLPFDKQNELLSFFCKNVEESKGGSTNGDIYKGLKIGKIKNVYYHEEEGVYPLSEIVGDYLFVFFQKMLLGKSSFPQVIESTNDLFLFFVDLLFDLFSATYPNRNLQNAIAEVKRHRAVVVKDMERQDLLDERLAKHVKALWKCLQEECLPVDHLLYENLLPADLYLPHILANVPDHFHVEEKDEEDYGDSAGHLSMRDVESFLLNGNKKVFYFERIFKTHVRLFSYSWVTIFLEILNRKFFGRINISSLVTLRGIKLYSIENKLNENIKMCKISYLVILDTQDREVNKHVSFLSEKKGRSRRKDVTTLTNLQVVSGGTATLRTGGQSINTRNGNPTDGDKGTPQRREKYSPNYVKKRTAKDKPCCAINYFNFYENNFIDLKKIANKISGFCSPGGEEAAQGEAGAPIAQRTPSRPFKKEPTKETAKQTAPNAPNGIVHFQSAECILFEWLYFHYNNVHYAKVEDKRYVFREARGGGDEELSHTNGAMKGGEPEGARRRGSPSGSTNCAPSGNPRFAPSGNPRFAPSGNPSFTPSGNPSFTPSGNPSFTPSGNPSFAPSGNPRFAPSGNPSFTTSGNPSFTPSGNPSFTPSGNPRFAPSGNPSFTPSPVGKNPKMSRINFQVEIKRKKKEAEKKKKVKGIDELKDLVMVLYTIISHIPYYLFFKNKIKVKCKSKRDYNTNVEILLIMLSEMKLSSLISRGVLAQFNHLHIYLFLASLYFILPSYLPGYYLILDDFPAYEVDLGLITDEVVNGRKKWKQQPGLRQPPTKGKQQTGLKQPPGKSPLPPQSKANPHTDGGGEKTGCGDGHSLANERIITVYNLNSHKCKYEVFLIGCHKYQLDRNHLCIDPLKAEQIKLKIDRGYDEQALSYSYHTSIKLSSFKKKRDKGDMCDGEEPHLEDSCSVSSCSSEECQCPSDGADKVDAGTSGEGRPTPGEDYSILVLRAEGNHLQDEQHSEKYICIKLVERDEKGKIELTSPGASIRGKQNEGKNVKANLHNGVPRSEVNKMRTANSSQLNIMLNDSEVKCFNLRGKVYERKCLEFNLCNNTGKEVEVRSYLYHVYGKDLKEEKRRGNLEADVVSSWGNSQCAVCSLVSANLRRHLSGTPTHFSCFHLSGAPPHFCCLQNERKKIQVQFCPFAEGSYSCFLLLNVNDKKSNYVVSACKVNCFFNVKNVKEEEVIKMRSQTFSFSYQLEVCPLNREFLHCVKFILCNLNHLEESHFLAYVRGYLKGIQHGGDNFYILCDNEDKVTIERGVATFGVLDAEKYVEKAAHSEGANVEKLHQMVKRDVNYMCLLQIAEQTSGVFEYNCALVRQRGAPRGRNHLSYEELRNLHIKEQQEWFDPFYKVYKIVANVNDAGNTQSLSITFKTSAFLMAKKTIPLYNYTNGVVTYRRVLSDVIDENNNVVDYQIFSCPEYVEIGKDVEFAQYEVSCYSIIGLTCSCCITLYNVNDEEDRIKINVQANVMKPYPKDTIHLKLLNRMKKTAQVEIYNELNSHCEFKVFSDLPILFGGKKIKMLPKERKAYTFFVTSAHIGEYMGCIIFKFHKLLRSGGAEEKTRDASFPFANYFFWYKLNITVELNKPLKILFLETNVGEEVTKEIVLKNNGTQDEDYFLLAYMNEYIERTQVQVPRNDIYVYSIRYAPKMPNCFEGASSGGAPLGENHPTVRGDLQNVYFPQNGDSEWCGPREEALRGKPSTDYPNEEAPSRTPSAEVPPNHGAAPKRKPFPPNEKKIFEELISYCKKYIQVDIPYRPQNIGFFFIYNRNEGINYYILMLLSRLRSELEVGRFSTCLSKSCLLHLHFHFNDEDKRYVHLLQEKGDPRAGNYHYEIGEGVKHPQGGGNALKGENFQQGTPHTGRAYQTYDDEWGEEIHRGDAKNGKDAPICKDNPCSGSGSDQEKHELKCIYLSNRKNFFTVNHEDVGRIVLKYRPTVGTSQECYAIVRSNLHGDFLYRISGTYTVKRRIKEKLVFYNSCCLYSFNVNLFNPFDCKVRVKCRFKGGGPSQACSGRGGVGGAEEGAEEGTDERDTERNCLTSMQTERVLLNNERNYLKMMNKENFKIKMRRHFTIMMTYFCKEVYSRRAVLVVMKPLRRGDATREDVPPMITYEYDFVFNNLLRSGRLPGALRCVPIAGEGKRAGEKGNRGEERSQKGEDPGVSTSCNFHSGVDALRIGSRVGGDFTRRSEGVEAENNLPEVADGEDNPPEVSDGEAHPSEQSPSSHTSRSPSAASERSHFTLNASELGTTDVLEGELKSEDADAAEFEKHPPGDKALWRPNDYNVEEDVRRERVLPCAAGGAAGRAAISATDSNEVVHYDGKVFIESMCKAKTCVEVHIDKAKRRAGATPPQGGGQLEGEKQEGKQQAGQNSALHRNVQRGKYNYKIFLQNVKNVRKGGGSGGGGEGGGECGRETPGMDVKTNALLFDVSEELLNDYLYVHLVEDTAARLVLSLELLALLPFHCTFEVLVSRTGEANEADEAGEANEADEANEVVGESSKGEPPRRRATLERNRINVEAFNCMNVSRQYLNITVDENLCAEAKLNIFYNHTSDAYFDAYVVRHNQLNSSSHLKDEIVNFDVKPKCGILKHGSYNKFFITRANRNGVVSFNNSFLFLIKTERNLFSYIVFSHYRPAPSDALATKEHNKIKEILNENKKRFSVLFSSFKQEKKESSIFNQKNQIIIEDISKSTNEIRNG